jgi:diacylglycerol kinase (ATP)
MKTGERMKIKVIINPQSRNGRSRLLENMLREKFAELTLDIERTSFPQHATDMARRAAKDNFDTVVVAGGDGTINEVINGIVGTKTALGIIPTGTANDLARYCRIPQDVALACDVILAGLLQHVDVIRVNGWHYVTAGGIGLASDIAKTANAIGRNGTMGRFLMQILGSKLYILAGLFQLLKKRGQNSLQVQSNGSLIKANALSLMVDNQPFLGRRFLISPGAINGDGLADVCLIENTVTLLPTALIVLKVLTGRHIYSSSVKTWRVKQMRIDTGKPMAFLGDGEIVGQGTRFDIKIIPNALRLLIPLQKESW